MPLHYVLRSTLHGTVYQTHHRRRSSTVHQVGTTCMQNTSLLFDALLTTAILSMFWCSDILSISVVSPVKLKPLSCLSLVQCKNYTKRLLVEKYFYSVHKSKYSRGKRRECCGHTPYRSHVSYPLFFYVFLCIYFPISFFFSTWKYHYLHR